MIRRLGMPRVFAAGMSLALAACGGGGGGDGGGSNGLTVTASGTSFQVVGVVPYGSASSSLDFTLHGGDGNTTYYADASSALSGLVAQVLLTSDHTATVTLADQGPAQASGRRSGTVTLRLCTDQNCAHVAWTHDYAVTVTRFQVDTGPLTLAATEGGSGSATLTVTPPDTDHLLTATAITTDGNPPTWLGATQDSAGNLLVTASGAGKAMGSYPAALTLSALQVPFGISVPVAFNIGLNLSASALADISERLATTAGGFAGSGSIAFAGAPGTWSASSDVPWLVIDTPSGTGAGSLGYHVDRALADAAIANWSSGAATITIQSPGLTTATTTLTYRRQLPEAAMIAPAQLWPGAAGTVRVMGRGLSQLSAASQVQVGGQPAEGGSIDSDTQATLQLSARSAGSYQVSIPNALGAATSQANLAVAPGRLPYAAVSSSGAKAAIVYDPSRLAVYAANYEGQALLRWKYDGAQWSTSAVPWAGIWRVQLSPDRTSLYVLDHNTLTEVDPDTLATRATWGGLSWGGTDFDVPMPVTNDQRLWLIGNPYTYFDLRTHGLVATHGFGFVGGSTTMIGTPDGSHVFSVGAPDWYTAATQDATTLPGDTLRYNYRASFDLQGDLGVFESESVYRTATWTLAGLAKLPSNEAGYGAVMSPDGTRLYRLSGPVLSATWAFDHIDVFDLTQLQPGSSEFAQIGTITMPDRASTCGDPSCDPSGRFEIDALGSTLFWAGNSKFLVIPIPDTLSGGSSAKRATQRLQPSAAMVQRRR